MGGKMVRHYGKTPYLLENAWSADHLSKWMAGGYRRLEVSPPARLARKMDLSFLVNLPRLEELDLTGRFPDDDLVFELKHLKQLVLWTAAGGQLRLAEPEASAPDRRA
jgi:hypothetical protein